ncbi:MAG: FtsX-like permease family protein [Deltaproteobacteria bacterium]|nr:FtsX-like permease family protein [Deltaproteobacteria bacterium]NIS77682.1 FtsX-like permease family protein [Deltaproteobacteria bacterium]
MYFQLGWRNIWRNPRRTMVILTAVIIGVWSMVFLGGLMRGFADQLVRNSIATLTGHIQVHAKGYRDDPAIEHSISDASKLQAVLESTLPPGANWAFRVRVSAVASNARHSSGVVMVGVEPEEEARVSFIGKAVTDGDYLESGDEYGIIVGAALFEKFETKRGHKLVLMAQDTQKEIASRAFRITGIFRAELEATEKQFVFVTMPAAKEMLKFEGGISEVTIVLPRRQGAERVAEDLRKKLSRDTYEVHTWRELLPLTTAILKMYDGFIIWWFLVVFIAMAFGIVNTTLMAVFERVREFGLQKALGMKPLWIVRGVITETACLLFLGMLAGNTLGYLTVYSLARRGIDLTSLSAGMEFFGYSRIIYPVIHGRDLFVANAVVLVLGLLVSLYPAVKAARISPVSAMTQT